MFGKVTSLATAIILVSSFTVFAEGEAAATTQENLQKAYQGKIDAKANCEAFAAKAQEEGYQGVASLFKAAAKTEGIRAAAFQAALKQLGVEAVTKPANAAEVKSTKENLEFVVKSTVADNDTVYPALAKQAETDKNEFATKMFKGTVAIEAAYLKLYNEALANLDTWKEAREFLVCQVCGWATKTDPALKQCPICSAPRSKFDSVK